MINIEVTVDDGIREVLGRAREAGVNLNVPFMSIAKSWFKSNRSIFTLQGPGQYPDYGGFNPYQAVTSGKRGGAVLTRRDLYKRQKQKRWGFVYPMMKASGRLEQSLTDPANPEAINLVVNNLSLYLGTRVSYAPYHQSDEARTKMPYRPIVFTGAEQIAPTEKKNEYTRFYQILEDSIQQQLDKAKS